MRKKRDKLTCSFLVFLSLFSIVSVFVVPAFANGTTKLYVDPPSVVDPTLTPPKTFALNVTLANVTDLVAFEYKFQWDPTVLTCTGYTKVDPVNDLGWGVYFQAKDALTAGQHWIAIAALLDPSTTPFNGSVVLASYTFQVMSVGSCALDILDEKLGNSSALQIPRTVEDSYFSNISPAKLYVDPPKIVDADLIPSESVSINISILNVINLYRWEFKLYYRNDILNGTGVTEGPFLNTSGTTNFVIIEFEDAFNATHGLVWVNCTLSAPPPVSGNGTLATISFHVEDLGESVLDLTDTLLTDPWNGSIPHNVFDGYFNNVLKAHLYVDPPSIVDPTLMPPATFTININVANVTDLYDYQFRLSYDSAILNCLGAIIIPFDGETHFIPELEVNEIAGVVWINVTYYPPAISLTTNDPVSLATIHFQVAALGNTVLDLYDTRLSDTLDGEIPHDVSDGFVSIVERDVAVTDVELSTNMIYVGRKVYINVTVANEGDMTETFNVSTYYDDTLIETLQVIGLAPDANTTITFTWDTTGATPCHNHTIKAEANAVPYETDTADNVYVDGKVKIKMLGDINGDGVIDIMDVLFIGVAFGSHPGHPKWSPEADLKPDSLIDIYDLVIIGVDFGKTC